jgi:tRNA 2-thiouridine synthesizing protein A
MAEMDGAAAIRPDKTLDATGLLCPLPVLKARRALRDLPAGGVLEVLATDPGAPKDFEHFCRTTGCTMIEQREQEGGATRFLLKKPA